MALLIIPNISRPESFHILGFPGLPLQYYAPVSALFFFIYLTTAAGNVFILAFVICQKSLQKPSYIVFCHLALNDLIFSTFTLPKIIAKYWFGNGDISFNACFTQMFMVHYLGSVMSFLLLVMALDRFIAVCVPLRYPVLITNNIISVLCGFAWFIPVPLMVTIVLHALTLSFCKYNTIAQCYCDHISLTNQGCGGNLREVQVTALCIAMLCLLLPLAFILFSYASIIVVILKMSSSSGRKKTLSTCTPQIFITCLFYLPRSFVYVASTVGFSFSLDIRILLILLYSLLPPALNPLIYCFKTRDIKLTLMRKLKMSRVAVEISVFAK